MRKLIFKILKISAPILLGFYLLGFFFQQMNQAQLNQFYKSVREANYWWIFISLIFSLLTFIIRAERWKLTLEPLGYQTNFTSRYHSLMIGYVMNLTIPRAGEATRSVMLHHSENVPFSQSFGTIISERIVDLFFLGSIVILTYTLNVESFELIFKEIQSTFGFTKENQSKVLFSMFIETAILIVFLLYIVLPAFRFKVKKFIKELFSGILSIFKMKQFGLYFAYSILIWTMYIFYFYICFYSLKETVTIGFNEILLAFIAGSVGIVFTNGGIGAFPLLIGIVIGIVNKNTIENAQAVGNALGMLIWVSETLLVIVLGIISLILLPKPYKHGSDNTIKK